MYCCALDTISLDCPPTNYEDDEKAMLDRLYNEAFDIAEIVDNKLLCEKLIKRMDELFPGISRAFVLKSNGLSNTEIARNLGISRTTLLYRMEKVKIILTEEFL